MLLFVALAVGVAATAVGIAYFQPRAVVGTGTHETTLVGAQVVVPPFDTPVGCPDGATVRVRTTGSTSGALMDARFFNWMED